MSPLSPAERDALLARVADAASDAILAFDDAGTIVLFNAAAERVLRCPVEEALGTPADRFGTDAGTAARDVALEQLARDPDALVFFGEAEGIEARRADGSRFRHEGSFSRTVVNGRVFHTVIFRDVAERTVAGRALVALQRQNAYLREELRAQHDVDEIVGRSPALAAVLEQVRLVATTDATVLVQGETGTGKELVARAIHARSARSDRPLVTTNCAALTPGLVESELFGHERGAFTGATVRRIGRFEIADGGTVFLDEVGELPLETQSKLLRVLQEREFERVGGTKTLRVDVRVVAATNRDLATEVAAGRFRQDLFYRLHVFPLAVPPLRHRPDDVALLAEYFAARFGTRMGRRYAPLDAATIRALQTYAWPGNVRELQNVIERAAILSPGPRLELPALDVPASARTATPAGAAPQAGDFSLEAAQRRHIVETLERAGWRIEGDDGAARQLGLAPSTLRSRMQQLGIARASRRGSA